MNKNIVVIINTYGNDKAMIVKDFSDENVKTAISNLMEINTKDLQCEASSMGGGIYKVTKKYRGLKEELKQIEGLSNQGDEVLIQLKYATLYS